MGVATKDSSKMAPVKVLKPRPEWHWKVLKLGMLALCLILFSWQFSYIFNDYLDGRTTITTEQGLCCHIFKDSISHHEINVFPIPCEIHQTLSVTPLYRKCMTPWHCQPSQYVLPHLLMACTPISVGYLACL